MAIHTHSKISLFRIWLRETAGRPWWRRCGGGRRLRTESTHVPVSRILGRRFYRIGGRCSCGLGSLSSKMRSWIWVTLLALTGGSGSSHSYSHYRRSWSTIGDYVLRNRKRRLLRSFTNCLARHQHVLFATWSRPCCCTVVHRPDVRGKGPGSEPTA
jgi:hypothetical protein